MIIKLIINLSGFSGFFTRHGRPRCSIPETCKTRSLAVAGSALLHQCEPLHLAIGGGQVIYNSKLFSLGLRDEQRRAIWGGKQEGP